MKMFYQFLSRSVCLHQFIGPAMMPQGQNSSARPRSEFERVFPELGFDNLQTRVDLETLLAGDQIFCRHQTRGEVCENRNVTNEEINGCFDVPVPQNTLLNFTDIAGHWIDQPTQLILGCSVYVIGIYYNTHWFLNSHELYQLLLSFRNIPSFKRHGNVLLTNDERLQQESPSVMERATNARVKK